MRSSLVCILAVAVGCRMSPGVPEKPVPSRVTLEPLCTTDIAPGLIVEIRDARSGRWIADSATVTARDGNFVDTLRAGAIVRDGSMRDRYGAYERPGTYALEVQRPGYRRWRASGVVLTKGACHVSTEVLHADLEPDH